MERKMETGAVVTIIIGTILLMITNYNIYKLEAVSDVWAVHICAVIVVMASSIYGMETGIMIPAAAALIAGVSFMGLPAVREMLLLLIYGVATGHYSDKIKVKQGEFNGIRIFDFCMLQTVLAILAWICVNPLTGFYLDRVDIRYYLNEGVKHCGISILAGIGICLPVLLLLNRLFRSRRLAMEAGREYMYTDK